MNPDLVLTFSDLQADFAAALLREGVAVTGHNRREVAGILAMNRHLGATVGQAERAASVADQYEKRLADSAAQAQARPRPTVYFEEWDDPMISGIGWVSELIEIAGGRDAFGELASKDKARDSGMSFQRRPIWAVMSAILWCFGKNALGDLQRMVRPPHACVDRHMH